MLRAALVFTLTACFAAAAQKPFIDCNREELARAVPELAGIQFDSNQDNLDGLLRATGENLEAMLGRLVNLSAAEEIHEIRLENSMDASSRGEAFRYLVKVLPNGGPERFQESRIDPTTKAPVDPPAQMDFLVTGRFLASLNFFLPEYRSQSRFRYLGRSQTDGQDLLIVALLRPPQSQGIAWIDAASKRIVRLRVDALGPIEGTPLESASTDIALVPVAFSEKVLWLPARVTVQARYAGGEFHSVHLYSDYQAEGAKNAGIPAVAAPAGEDAYELLARGVALSHEGKFGEAIAPLREAMRVDPAMAAAQFHLANALRSTGDLAGAEAQLRETEKLAPDSGEVHNLLGIILFKRSEAPAAVAELRRSVELQPKQAVVRFNLAQALEASGDKSAALEQYRAAAELAPENAAFKARYERLAHAANAPAAPETTIKVEVRQVLVPVIVTDKEGHHVTGLTKADFQVFEDGVEQNISAFSVEDAALTVPPDRAGAAPPAEPAAEQAAPSAPAAAPPKPIPPKRTYVICIDSLHAAFGNLVQVRQAVSKLFQTEQAADSKYVVLAIGTATQVVQDTTSDPQKVLQAIGSKDFQKLFLASRKSSVEADLISFRRTLDHVRVACDNGDPECSMKRTLPSLAEQIASQERIYAAAFLSQLDSLVQTLSHVPGRRTIVLVSDGFQLVPGKQAYELLLAYFPDLRTESLHTVDRMTDLDPILRHAANHNIPIYTIDSRGLYTDPSFDASNPGGVIRLVQAVSSIMNSDASDAGATLSEIAAATGGTAFQNSNDILTGLRRAFADGREYYMLAYVPANSNLDGKFRSISIKLRDKKMVVTAKRGYWATGN